MNDLVLLLPPVVRWRLELLVYVGAVRQMEFDGLGTERTNCLSARIRARFASFK